MRLMASPCVWPTSAALQASPMGRSVYARMGYREVGAYRIFADFAGH